MEVEGQTKGKGRFCDWANEGYSRNSKLFICPASQPAASLLQPASFARPGSFHQHSLVRTSRPHASKCAARALLLPTQTCRSLGLNDDKCRSLFRKISFDRFFCAGSRVVDTISHFSALGPRHSTKNLLSHLRLNSSSLRGVLLQQNSLFPPCQSSRHIDARTNACFYPSVSPLVALRNSAF